MKKIFFVIADYPEGTEKHRIFHEVFSPRNEIYCKNFGFEYRVLKNLKPFRGNITWNKISQIKEWIDSGVLEDGDVVTNFDADCFFCRTDIPLWNPMGMKSINYAIDSGNTHCFGWVTFLINEWSRNLIDKIISQSLWDQESNKLTLHPGFQFREPTSFLQEFREQAMYYRLMGIPRHSWMSFLSMENLGIDTVDAIDPSYVQNLHNTCSNIGIVNQAYNCTIWPGESDTRFYINPIEEKGLVIVRHFTGSDWNNYKKWDNLN